jgi:phosphotransferase system enzyme I (PtsP)
VSVDEEAQDGVGTLLAPSPTPPPAATLHDQPGGQIDAVLDYLAFVAKSRPLSVLLDEAPRKIARCIQADVASLYLLEGDGRSLVMRGNVGFPKRARGTVRLEVGEGITGLAVELAYPISVALAPEHAHYRSFPELEEERFPSFLAVPIAGSSGVLGCVVVQRRAERPFSENDVSLVAALTAPISSGLRMARLLDDLRDRSPKRTGSGTRKATLPGTPVVAGRALGAIAAIRRPAKHAVAKSGAMAQEMLSAAFDTVDQAVKDLISRAGELSEETSFLNSYALMLADQNLRQGALAQLDQGFSIGDSLGDLARRSSRAATRTGDAFMMDRAKDMEQLCDALLMIASPDSRAILPSKSIIVADSLSIYDVLISARTQPVGFALTERDTRPRTRALLEIIGVPAIVDVVGAFRWIAPGDIALLDADHGFLIVNPSRAEVTAYRAQRKRRESR